MSSLPQATGSDTFHGRFFGASLAESDPELARARYETDYAALKTAKLVPVAKTGHFIMLDRPEVVLEALKAAAR